MYRVEHSTGKPDEFGIYRFKIFLDGKVIATYWHDHRGDEQGIDFVDGRSLLPPPGIASEFISGGGPLPLELTEKAIDFLENCLKPRLG